MPALRMQAIQIKSKKSSTGLFLCLHWYVAYLVTEVAYKLFFTVRSIQMTPFTTIGRGGGQSMNYALDKIGEEGG